MTMVQPVYGSSAGSYPGNFNRDPYASIGSAAYTAANLASRYAGGHGVYGHPGGLIANQVASGSWYRPFPPDQYPQQAPPNPSGGRYIVSSYYPGSGMRQSYPMPGGLATSVLQSYGGPPSGPQRVVDMYPPGYGAGYGMSMPQAVNAGYYQAGFRGPRPSMGPPPTVGSSGGDRGQYAARAPLSTAHTDGRPSATGAKASKPAAPAPAPSVQPAPRSPAPKPKPPKKRKVLVPTVSAPTQFSAAPGEPLRPLSAMPPPLHRPSLKQGIASTVPDASHAGGIGPGGVAKIQPAEKKSAPVIERPRDPVVVMRGANPDRPLPPEDEPHSDDEWPLSMFTLSLHRREKKDHSSVLDETVEGNGVGMVRNKQYVQFSVEKALGLLDSCYTQSVAEPEAEGKSAPEAMLGVKSSATHPPSRSSMMYGADVGSWLTPLQLR